MSPDAAGQRYQLFSATAMPQASAFLWNKSLLVQLTCRGYATAQFMQPEPAKYAHAPNLAAKTFMQPEQPYYAHHPGRFVYVKDQDSGELWSVPYEPVRKPAASFVFSAGTADICWQLELSDDLRLEWRLSLAPDAPLELWQLRVRNLGTATRRLSLYPYFPVGYMSWMNQGGRYEPSLQAVVCSSVTPYQKYPDYFKQKDFKDQTFLLAERAPLAWEANQQQFEGEGGLAAPDGISAAMLRNGNADYETPACALQYDVVLSPGATELYRFVFGPAKDLAEIAAIRRRFFGAVAAGQTDGFIAAVQAYRAQQAAITPTIQISTPDAGLDNFVNQWLPRQVYYHGEVNRLTTDPQTRNYLQDHLGMTYLAPDIARSSLLTALAQQHQSGEMPDGILLHPDAQLKYINQVPHTDQCVWLPLFLRAYLDETNDWSVLDEQVGYKESTAGATSVREHLHRAMAWLWQKKDHRGLSYIEQGDWCDPMNMVGYKGRGVSGWLSLAAAYALNTWAELIETQGQTQNPTQSEAALADDYRAKATAFNQAVNQYLWDGQWYGRGITDDDVVFGVSKDHEGRIYLNPQSWALLSGAASPAQQQALLQAVDAQLHTPYGVQMLAPAYTAMRDDVGRVTQKFPGSAENGSVYNHAAAFYLYALYQIGDAERAFQVLRQMLPSDDEADQRQRGQLPVFLPNYYRGAYSQYPRTAGRSSQLFNTGTVHWLYRCLIEHLFGLKGEGTGLRIAPQLPAHWSEATVTRRFRGAVIELQLCRQAGIMAPQYFLGQTRLAENLLTDIQPGQIYRLSILLPL
ncbi:MAG: NdvB protein [Rheinheimera sp.]|nr:NdvB protein [Rheinheimera sp.]